MSYPMSPPSKPPPRPYSPYGNAGSPTNSFAPPPAKRQRLSPGAGSPQGTQNYAPPNGLLNMGQGSGGPVHMNYSPYTSNSFNTGYANSPQSSFNTPQPYQPPQHQQYGAHTPSQSSPPMQNSMPPPPRPNKEEREEKIDANDLNDALFQSGVNLKDEENYLHATYYNHHSQNSFNTNQTSSFGSSTLSPSNSFGLLTQGGSFQNGAFSGTLGASASQEAIERETKQKHARAARIKAEKEQYHLREPFLQGNNLRYRLNDLAYHQGVRLDVPGLFNKVVPQSQVMVGADGGGIVAARPEGLLETNSPFADMLSLVSLAANERLRALLDEAYALARARRYGSHGVVAPDFADIAAGDSEAKPAQAVPDSMPKIDQETASTPQDIQTDGASQPPPQPTISFSDSLNLHLRKLADRDKAAEKERLKKREARRRAAENLAQPDDPSEPGTPAEGGMAPIKLTKKEIAAQKKANASESVLHTTTNQTAAAFALGKKGKQYAWMSGGGGAINRFAKPSPPATPAGNATTGSGTATPAAGLERAVETRAPAWGDFREDGVEGRGIQIRDWVLVLERDGREKVALQKVMNRLA